MPQRSRNERYYHEYGALANQEAQPGLYTSSCEFPALPEKFQKPWHRHLLTSIVWTGILSMAGFIAVAVVIVVLISINPDTTSRDTNSPDYALYKNSRFKECYDLVTPPDSTNCTAIRATLDRGPNPEYVSQGIGYVWEGEVLDLNHPVEDHDTFYDWCQVMGCVNGFKVVPSTPRPSAIWGTVLTTWGSAAGLLLASLWQFRKRHADLYRSNSKPCKGVKELSWFDWFIHLYEASSFVWWWISFGRFAISPQQSIEPSFVGWIAPWKYAALLRYHPYSCAFKKHPKVTRTATWVLNLIAVAQWIATVYDLYTNWTRYYGKYGTRSEFPTYDCLASQIPSSPGNSPCTPEVICSQGWLFIDPGFKHNSEVLDAGTHVLILFIMSSLMAGGPIILVGISALISCVSRDREFTSMKDVSDAARQIDIGPTAGLTMVSFYGVVLGALVTVDAVRWGSNGRESAVNFFWECKAVHVAVSPWRYYLDVEYERVLRLVKLWFNV